MRPLARAGSILSGLAVVTACSGNPTAPTDPGPADPTGPAVPQQSWRGLTIAAEDRCSPYSTDEYDYPASIEAEIVRNLGSIFSPYTCETFESTRETDIEHIIARSEAHDSGLRASSTGVTVIGRQGTSVTVSKACCVPYGVPLALTTACHRPAPECRGVGDDRPRSGVSRWFTSMLYHILSDDGVRRCPARWTMARVGSIPNRDPT